LRADLATTAASLHEAQVTIAKLKSTFAQAQHENKALQAKLSATRSASAPVDSVTNHSKPAGGAMNGKGTARTGAAGPADTTTAAQLAQLKEELYSDLTGLIVLGVDRRDEADVYDCIQTGRERSTCLSPLYPSPALAPLTCPAQRSTSTSPSRTTRPRPSR
jgi:Tfp pilus assembly protein FimV